jgi:hypothetical protein
MNTRRDFLSVAFKGSAMAAATAFLSGSDPALAGSVSGRSVNPMGDTINNGSTRHYKPPFRFGRGGVPLGNEFAVVTDKDAYGTLEAAWAAGVRYYDVALGTVLVWRREESATSCRQDFALKNPGNPYIMICDRPKIAALKKEFPGLFVSYKGQH